MALISIYGIRFPSYSGYKFRVWASILIMCKIDYSWKLKAYGTNAMALGMP
jgi:hypothetical protein